MITELNKKDFYKIRHITDKCKNIEVRAVIQGNNPGTVYVDHPNGAYSRLNLDPGPTKFSTRWRPAE